MTISAPSQPNSGNGDSPRIAYLLSRYPAVSHTFFLKEVLGLRDRLLHVEVASINAPDRPMHALSPVEQEEARKAHYVKAGNKLGALLTLIAIVLRNPVVALRGLSAAAGLGGWDLRACGFSMFYLAEALLVGDWMRRRALSHLHVHFGGAVASVGMLVSAAWRIPWSLTVHGPDEFFNEELFFLKRKFESSSFLFCISDNGRSQVLRVAPGLDPDKVEVIRLGVDCAQLQPKLEDDVSPKSGPVRVVCTGRLVAAKGHRTLLQAAAQLHADGVPFELFLIGDGPERRALEEQCIRSGISGQVHFTGALNHAEALAQVAQSDIFVLASFAEGLPVALMEAMALGVVCVSTWINGIPELIADGKNGRLAAAGNAGELAAALAGLARDRSMRHSFGLAARNTVEEHYNLRRNQDLLAAAFRRRLAEVK